jgi:hypothetical protein
VTEGFKILLMSVVASLLYGVAHDQVTARICIEYFTIGHARVFESDSLTLLALGQGILSTWWYGMLLGIPLAAAARAGSKPKTKAATLRRPLGFLVLRVAIYSLLGGLAGYYAASQGWVTLVGSLAHQVVDERGAVFIAVLWAHWTAYGSAALEGLLFCVRTWRRRGAPARPAH